MGPAVSATSPLCARHDGMMLGYLLFLLRFEFARERFPIYRRRLHQILDAISSGVALPETHEAFTRDFSALFDGVLHALSVKDGGVNQPLFRPFVIGCGFLAVAMEMPNQTNEPMLRAILAEYEIPYSLLERHAAAVPEIGDETEIDTIMTPALAFLRDLILPLAAEPDTCFVAMPFSQPYDDRYPALPLGLGHDDSARPLSSMNPRRDLVGSHIAEHLHAHGRPGDVLHGATDQVMGRLGRPNAQRPNQNAPKGQNS